jgi:hypothetical protein
LAEAGAELAEAGAELAEAGGVMAIHRELFDHSMLPVIIAVWPDVNYRRSLPRVFVDLIGLR